MFALRLILLFCCAASAAWADCAPDPHPDPSFAQSLKLASKGDVIEQRNVAASYEAGYLVERCFPRAYFWYQQAAQQGDAAAADWLARNQALKALLEGPECYGSACQGIGVNSGATGTAFAGNNGHFFAPLSVNGKTIQGLIDTGATLVALKAEDAATLGLDFASGVQSTSGTANGALDSRIVTVPKLTVAGIALDNVQVACCINSPVSLIGMSFLSRVRFSVTGNTLNIHK